MALQHILMKQQKKEKSRPFGSRANGGVAAYLHVVVGAEVDVDEDALLVGGQVGAVAAHPGQEGRQVAGGDQGQGAVGQPVKEARQGVI